MQSHKSNQDDTTKAGRSPRNLLEYVLDQSPNEDLFALLAKHHPRLKIPLSCNANSPELTSAIFIVELNKFSTDLIKAAEICAQIDSEVRNHHKNLEKNREALRNYDSDELANAISSLYIDARNFDNFFSIRHWIVKLNGRPALLPISLFTNPFWRNSNLSNEENICNLAAAFKIHDDFFINYLNVLYGEGEEGENFAGKTFESVSSEYRKIKGTIADINKITPDYVPNDVVASVDKKRVLLAEILEKYPATLYRAVKIILKHLDASEKQ